MSANRPNLESGDPPVFGARLRWSQQEVLAAWSEAFGRQCSAAMTRTWRVAGWPLTAVADLRGFVDRAFAGNTGLARGALSYAAQFNKSTKTAYPSSAEYARATAAARLNEVVRVYWLEGVTDWAEMSAWLAVVAGDPDEDSAEHARDFALGSPVGLVAAGFGIGDFAAWRQSLPGSLAALALAAGLTLNEARAQQAAGRLDPDALRALAGLRGYHLHSPAEGDPWT